MAILKACWALIFFFAGLILFFVWSKLLVINKRVASIQALLQELEKLDSHDTPSAASDSRRQSA